MPLVSEESIVFRLLWLNIAMQMMLLVAAVACVALYAVHRVTAKLSEELLMERSTSSIADECRLRGYSLQEAVRSICRRVRDTSETQAKSLQRSSGEAVRQVFLAAQGPEEATHGAIEEVRLVRLAENHQEFLPIHRLARGEELQDGKRLWPTNKTIEAVLNQFRPRVDPVGPVQQSSTGVALTGLILDERNDLGNRYLLGVGYRVSRDLKPTTRGLEAARPGDWIFVAVIDFTRLVENQARRMPGYLLLVQDREGKWVNHPDPERIGSDGEQLPVENDWPESKQRRGEPFDPRPLPELAYYTVRVRLPASLIANSDATAELEKALLQLNGLRLTRLWETTPHLTLSARDESVLEEARRIINRNEFLATQTKPISWRSPVFCETFRGHRLYQFPLDSDAGLNVNLILAAAMEELTVEAVEDVRAGNKRLWYYWFIPVVMASAALALFAAYLLTRPLRRLTEAVQRLAQGDYSVEVQVLAPGEVGELARSIAEMTARIRSRERELRENLARLSTIMANAADGIITFDQAGRIEDANAAAEEMFGFSGGDLKGVKVQRLMKLPEHLQTGAKNSASFSSWSSTGSHGPQLGGTVTQLFNAVKTPGEEHRGLRGDGKTFWMEVTFSQVPIEDRRLIIGIFRDVTRRKIDEERIRQMNEDLEARVQLRTAELADAKTKLELALAEAKAANASKDRFISVVSHELRTPLTSAMGYTELLLNPRATKLRENPGPTLEKILTACKYLSTLINDLLDVSRYTAGKPIDLAPTRFELTLFLLGVKEMVAPLVKKNDNVMETILAPGLGSICNDETRLRQVLLNLLSNACKFTEKGKVTLQVERLHDGEGDWLRFRVSDTGAGMSSEQLAKLFTPFYRGDNSTTRKQGGTGLGLTITKMICELMGGSIRVESTLGQGSVFTVTVPTEVTGKPGATSGSTELVDSAKAHRGKVLVIDDDATIRHMLETYLQNEGYLVLLAESGSQGLKLAREHQPTCITLDVMMPNEDGWDVLARLKNDPATRDIPVIMLTIMEDRNRGFALGATEYVTKPIDWGRLGSILCRYNPSQAPILIVEDDDLQRGYLREELILAGWTVLEASNGVEALKICETTTPSLILLDLTMPIMDGFTFLDELRRREAGGNIPVVVVTARELSGDERRLLNRSVAQVLAKEALSKEQLLSRIHEQLQAVAHRV